MLNQPANLESLMENIKAEVGATEAAVFGINPDFFDGRHFQPLIHLRPDDSDPAARRTALAAFQDLINPCVQSAKDGIIEIASAGNDTMKQFCLITLAHRENTVVGASAFIVPCRDAQDAEIAMNRIQRAVTRM